MLLRADVAVHFIPTRMAHGFLFAQLAAVLALADGGMIVRDLTNAAAANLVEPGIADVSHYGLTVLDDDGGQYTGHAVPFRIAAGGTQDFVVCHGDGFAQALLGGAGLPLEARADPRYRDFRSLLAGGRAADA